jgi:hypothetical protein
MIAIVGYIFGIIAALALTIWAGKYIRFGRLGRSVIGDDLDPYRARHRVLRRDVKKDFVNRENKMGKFRGYGK